MLTLSVKCHNKRKPTDKNLLGNGIRLYEHTKAWELAKTVEAQKTTRLSSNDTSLVNFQEGKFGMTLLNLAVYNNKFESAKSLLELGANLTTFDFSMPNTRQIEKNVIQRQTHSF